MSVLVGKNCLAETLYDVWNFMNIKIAKVEKSRVVRGC